MVPKKSSDKFKFSSEGLAHKLTSFVFSVETVWKTLHAIALEIIRHGIDQNSYAELATYQLCAQFQSSSSVIQ